jgi:EAL domain-containing protein (putative c-di-GMP-specific phosphodiesterase class I)
VVALLRQVLSEPERQAVSVFRSDGREFPRAQTLDDWWRLFQTEWFATALHEDRFTTWFQPIVDTNRHRVLAHECLIRLENGRIYNGSEIVDAARLRGEIHAFDSYARRLAIRSAARQSPAGIYFVNFIPSSIYNPEYCMKSTMQALNASGMSPANVVFEVVESDMATDTAHLRRICDYYRGEGFAFALDDVGTGTNSLQMVCDLQPNYVKLDKSLTQNVEQPMYAATIRKLVELADQFGVTVIAEGVERTQTMENLWLLGVECMQGYLFGRPAPEIGPGERDLTNLAHALKRDKAPTETHVLS